MSVKILHRRSKLAPSSGITLMNMDPPAKYNALPNLFDRIDKAFPHRKSADGGPLSVLDRIKEFIHFKKPDIDMGSVGDILQKLKVPGLVLLGVAFVGGLIYLAYKLYRNWSDKKAEDTINTIMKDFANTAPELLEVPGWQEKVRNEVADAVYSGNEQTMVESITKIKSAIVEKQQSLGKKVGAGIDLFLEDMPTLKARVGRGAIMPIL